MGSAQKSDQRDPLYARRQEGFRLDGGLKLSDPQRRGKGFQTPPSLGVMMRMLVFLDAFTSRPEQAPDTHDEERHRYYHAIIQGYGGGGNSTRALKRACRRHHSLQPKPNRVRGSLLANHEGENMSKAARVPRESLADVCVVTKPVMR